MDLAGISSSQVMAGIARGGVVPAMVGQTREHVKARPMSSTPSVHTIVSEPEAVDPIDYEEFVSQQSERDPLAQVLDFPEDDIEVNLVPRKIRTEEHVVPEEPYSQLDPTVQNCVDCYTSDWVVVNRKYQQYSSSLITRDRGEEKMAVVQNTPRQQFECDDTPDPTPEFEVMIDTLHTPTLYSYNHANSFDLYSCMVVRSLGLKLGSFIKACQLIGNQLLP